MSNTVHKASPVWLIEMAIEPKSRADTGRLKDAFARMSLDDSTFGYSEEPGSGALIIRGVSERQLDSAVDVLKHKLGGAVLAGAPRVAYRETIKRIVEVDYTHKKQTGGMGEFARVKLRLEPNECGEGNEFAIEISGTVIPKEYIAGVEKGVQSVWDAGVLVGYPMVDTKVTLYDGAFQHSDSNAIAFEIAARIAMREGVENAGVKLLEPIMNVEVVTPLDFIGSVIADLNKRRGYICSHDVHGTDTPLRAQVPLAKLFGYGEILRSMTGGHATCNLSFSHWAEVPQNDGPDTFPSAVGMRA